MYYLQNYEGKLANKGCTGQHNCIPVDSILDAVFFYTYSEASEFSQNFGPDWTVTSA